MSKKYKEKATLFKQKRFKQTHIRECSLMAFNEKELKKLKEEILASVELHFHKDGRRRTNPKQLH